MPTIKVLPRDLQPGDKIDRLDENIDVVQATVREVKKVHAYQGHTAYKVYFKEYDALPEYQKSVGNSHLKPCIFQARNRVTVEREA